MYTVDRDALIELQGVTQSSVGAPLPVVLSDERSLILAYLTEQPDPTWDGTWVRVVGADTAGEQVSIIRFRRYLVYMFGPPNDEAIHGHPLYSRSLHPYGAFKVLGSSWIAALERMNSVHPFHNPKRFESLNHYIFTFHDSTFECVAESFDVGLHVGSMKSAVAEMGTLLER